jgi:hypothetical protein
MVVLLAVRVFVANQTPWTLRGVGWYLGRAAAYCHVRRDKLFASRYTIASLWMQSAAYRISD